MKNPQDEGQANCENSKKNHFLSKSCSLNHSETQAQQHSMCY